MMIPGSLQQVASSSSIARLPLGRPILFETVPELREASKSWDFDFFRAQGNPSVAVEHYPSLQRCDVFQSVHMSMAEYIERLRECKEFRQSHYLAEIPVENAFDDTANCISLATPTFLRGKEPKFRRMLFLGIDTFSTAHYHRQCDQALLCQLEGEKVVRLFPPAVAKHLSLWPWYAPRSNHSQIRFSGTEQDTELLPDAAKSEMIEVTVRPGQALYIPDHWVHLVYGRKENISVTYFWNGGLSSAHLLGVIRDSASLVVRSSLGLVSRLAASILGVERVSRLGVRLGMISEADRDAVAHNLESLKTRRA